MNPKLKLALILSRSRSREQGAVLPVIIGIGLVMTIAGTTMIIRSSDEQTTAVAQNQTAQALASAEAGITRTMSKFGQVTYAAYLLADYDPNNVFGNGVVDNWTANNLPDSDYEGPCAPQTDAEKTAAYNSLIAGTMGSGEAYSVIAYQYTDGNGDNQPGNGGTDQGTLIVEGEKGDNKAQVQIDIEVSFDPVPNSFPGLFAESIINIGVSDITAEDTNDVSAASIICTDCPVDTNFCNGGQLNETGYRDAIGVGGNGTNQNADIDGKIVLGVPKLPPLPTAPANSLDLGAVNSDLNIPADLVGFNGITATDIADATIDGVLHIKASSISGNNDISVDTSGIPIYLYVSGDMSMGGNGSISHTGDFGDFRIFGQPDNGDTTIDQDWSISGNATGDNVFIYAPDAEVTMNGSGNNNPDYSGVMWVKQYTGNGQGVNFQVPTNADTALGGAFTNAAVVVNNPTEPRAWGRRER